MSAASSEMNAERKSKLASKIDMYLREAEILKDRIAKDQKLSAGQTQRRHERTIEIPEDSTGFSYDTLFHAYIQTAARVVIRDPYVRRPHQIHNLVRFCELCIHHQIKQIELVTGQDSPPGDQAANLEELRKSLAAAGIAFSYTFDSALHDRDVSFSNGWIVRLGRGLDMYKRCEGSFVLGVHDMALRKTYATNVDVWFEQRK